MRVALTVRQTHGRNAGRSSRNNDLTFYSPLTFFSEGGQPTHLYGPELRATTHTLA